MTRWLTLPHAAAYVTLSEGAFKRLVRKGTLPQPEIRYGREQWSSDAIDAIFLGHKPDDNLRRDTLDFDGQVLSPDEIVRQAAPWMKLGTGIYFLISGSEIVYVGQAVDVLARLTQHAKEKEFDSWHWIPCELGALDATEKTYILALRPRLNQTLVGGRKK